MCARFYVRLIVPTGNRAPYWALYVRVQVTLFSVMVWGETTNNQLLLHMITRTQQTTYGDQRAVGELAHNGVRLVALLLLHQLVTVQRDDALHLAAVQRLLVELLAQLELDGGGLERGHSVEGVLVALLGQLDGRADGVAHLAQHQADAYVQQQQQQKRI